MNSFNPHHHAHIASKGPKRPKFKFLARGAMSLLTCFKTPIIVILVSLLALGYDYGLMKSRLSILKSAYQDIALQLAKTGVSK